MEGNNANKMDLKLLADEIKNRPLLTQYLTPAKKRGYVCIGCGNGSGDDGTGAEVSKDSNNRLLCGKCQGSFSNIDIIANYLGLGTTGKDFFDVIKFGCQEFGLHYPDETPTTPTVTKKAESKIEKAEPFDRLEDAQKNLADFVKNQGGKWRGLSLETLQRNKCGYLPNVYFPAAGKELPAVVIPNDLGGVYFRSIEGKFHKNNSPMATTTVFIPDAEEFDLFVTEGQVNALSIFQAVPNPKFGIMACSGTSGENNILAKLKQLTAQGKKFRVILAFDNDSNGAGQNAADKAVKTLIKAGYSACMVNISQTPDFDLNDVLRQNNGNHYLYTLINSAIDFAKFEFEKIDEETTKELFGDSKDLYFANDFLTDIDDTKMFEDRKTGFSNLDDEINCLLPGIYVIGGLPALGKTTFALQLLDQMANNGETCFFCSYEMSKKFLYSKLVAREVFRLEKDKMEVKFSLSATDISLNKINDFHRSYFDAALINFRKKTPLYIWELEEVDIDKLLARLGKICDKLDKPPIVCIDYLQIFGLGSDNTKSSIDKVLHKLFNFRRDTNTTFFLISSINRANYNTEISFESLKETGGIEFSADAIWGLQLLLEDRDRKKADAAMKNIPREIQLKCLKNRFGKRFDVGFFYYPNADTFIPMLEYGEYNQNTTRKGDTRNDTTQKYTLRNI